MTAKLLLIGPRENKKNPSDTGGAVVLFENLLEEVSALGIPHDVVDTRRVNYRHPLLAYPSVMFQILRKQRGCRHLSLHSTSDYLLYLPLLLVIGWCCGQDASLRVFGAALWDKLHRGGSWTRRYQRLLLSRVDHLFVETRQLVEQFRVLNPRVHWFPNVRRPPDFALPARTYDRRFVFVGHVKAAKGMEELLAVAARLPSDYTIDVYGGIEEPAYTPQRFEKAGVRYRGVLSPHEVMKTLSRYDVLLLPSHREGYPGVVIEAYAVGLPVIVTDLPGTREIVDDGQTGLLIEKKNVDALEQAMRSISEENYPRMSTKAREKFVLFDSRERTRMFCSTVL